MTTTPNQPDPLVAAIADAVVARVRLELCAPTPEALTRAQAAALCGISLSLFARMESDGTLGPMPVTIGGTRAVRYLRAEVMAWLASGAVGRLRWQSIKASQEIRRAGRRNKRSRHRTWLLTHRRAASESANEA